MTDEHAALVTLCRELKTLGATRVRVGTFEADFAPAVRATRAPTARKVETPQERTKRTADEYERDLFFSAGGEEPS